MKTLSIVCASSLAGGAEAFATLGEVVILPEPEINASSIRGASVLATRSKVKVNDALLAGSSIAFYGTATAGTDHIDLHALESRGIAWTAAPGSNANSVAEYIIAALARLGSDRHTSWRGRTIGIVGAGHVGSRLANLAGALGMNVRLNDPPLAEKTNDPRYRPLAEVLESADVVTLHVPLTDEGPQATRRMANAAFFSAMKKGSVFMNASRGEVVDEAALLEASRSGRFSAVVLDVFDHEPDIDPRMPGIATLASPHIAGYSLDARLNGTLMVYRAACEYFGVNPVWQIPRDANPGLIALDATGPVDLSVYRAILQAYDPLTDDQLLRNVKTGTTPGQHFQQLRMNYAERREFARFQIKPDAAASPPAIKMMADLGFMIKPSAKRG